MFGHALMSNYFVLVAHLLLNTHLDKAEGQDSGVIPVMFSLKSLLSVFLPAFTEQRKKSLTRVEVSTPTFVLFLSLFFALSLFSFS